MFTTALLAAIIYFALYGGNVIFGQCMIDRPIVVGLITGLIMGDLETGILMGAALEAIFMGAVYIGGQLSAEPAAATIFAVTFAITQGVSTDAALALAIPIGILSAFVAMFTFNIVLNAFVPLLDKYAQENNIKGFTLLHYGCWVFRFLLLSILMFAGIYLGSDAVATLVNNIPDVVMRGLTAAGSFLPAVGFAILLKMLWSKDIAIYYFLGFILVIYLELPLIAVSALGLIVVVANAIRDLEMAKLKSSGINNENTDELEEFFA